MFIKKEWFVDTSNLFTWKFLNFVIIAIGASTYIFNLQDELYNPVKYNLYILFAALIEGISSIASIDTTVAILENVTCKVAGANGLQVISSQLEDNPLSHHPKANPGIKIRLKIKKKSLLIEITLITALLPPIALILRLDVPYYLFEAFCAEFARKYP